jgi:hypothetical protein
MASTINRAVPANKSALTSAPLRTNFNAAADDIEALQARVTTLETEYAQLSGLPISKIADFVMGASDAKGQHYNNYGAPAPVDFVLPPAARGARATFTLRTNQLLRLVFSGGGKAVNFDLQTSADGTLSTDVVNSTITLQVEDESGEWVVEDIRGEWNPT